MTTVLDATDPRELYPAPPFHTPRQSPPSRVDNIDPKPDQGETAYYGSNKLDGRVALITGADSGIGRAVALALSREGADVAIAYLDEHHDAHQTVQLVEGPGRKAISLAGDVGNRSGATH